MLSFSTMARVSKIKYRFGNQGFSAKSAVMEYCAAMRARYGIGIVITAPEDHLFLLDLVSGHINSSDKAGVGIKNFFVQIAPEHGTTCFWLERVDGTKTDFGVKACIDAVSSLNRQSLREAIAPQMDAFKSRALAGCGDTFISAYSGRAYPVGEAVADHVRPFEQIISEFFAARGVDLSTELLTRSVDARSKPTWRDPQLITDFLAYHSRHELRLVHARENLSEIKIENNAAAKAIQSLGH